MQDLRKALQHARRQYQAGGASVLDLLLRQVGASDTQSEDVNGDEDGGRADLLAALRQHAGVLALTTAARATPDYARLDRATADRLGVVPLRVAGEDGLCVGLADPWDDALVRRLSAALGFMPQLVALPATLLETWLGPRTASALTGAVAQFPPDNADSATNHAPDGAELVTAHTAQPGVQRSQASGPVVDFVDSAICAAFASGASDIHFECGRAGMVVKLRQDGVMVSLSRMDDAGRAEEVISRIKVLAQLDITERRTPQDGRFRFDLQSRDSGSIDLRVSIIPSVFGEDAVLRLLDKAQLRTRDATVTLDLLGFGPDSAERIRELAELPHGMLLVTGPTGSGKTTTVYAMLSEINTGLEKIITIEDPVEYELSGVLQIPVNERKGLTFAKGLRSILRHDPDRILVGEIRDAETAEIAVQSALTGHQVLTTVHANSVFDVTGRFRHFGLDMFGFMASLNGVIVQRLVRRICPHCAGHRAPSARELRWLASLGCEAGQFAASVGCDACHGSGYQGRSVLAEVHAVDDGFRDMVTGQQPVSVLREHVHQSGVTPLALLAARMVLGGLTTPEEIKRVVGFI